MSPEDIEALNNGHQEIARELPWGLQPLPAVSPIAPKREPLCLVCGEETIAWARHTNGTGALDDDWLCKDCYQTSQRKSREPWWLPIAKFLVS